LLMVLRPSPQPTATKTAKSSTMQNSRFMTDSPPR
jgi:hypothetical protein